MVFGQYTFSVRERPYLSRTLLTLQSQLQCIFYTDVFPHNVLDDLPVNQLDAHMLCILYIKQSSPLLFGAQIKNIW